MEETAIGKTVGVRQFQPALRTYKIAVSNCSGEQMVGVFHETTSKVLVIICHGFRSSKGVFILVNLASYLQRAGINAYRFDFSGNGESEGEFEYNNYGKQVEEVRSVVQHFQDKKGYIIPTIIGHSQGGNVVLLYASKYHDVHSIINLGARFYQEKGFEKRLGNVNDLVERIKREGYIDLYNRRGEFHYRVTEKGVMDRLSTDMGAVCQSIHQNCRVLTVFGSVDQMVPLKDAMEITKAIPNGYIHVIDGGDHEFILRQPELCSIVVEFINTYLLQTINKLGNNLRTRL